MGFMELYVDSQGNVLSGCQVLPPMGNILRSDLQEILATEAYQKRVRNMATRKCPGCTCGYGVNEILRNLPKYVVLRVLEKKRVLPS
jgi:hypothetical protein